MRGPRRAGGFTLIEVLLATVLLAAGLALAFATLTAANGTALRGERLASESERMRAVEGFVRRRLAAARPMVFEDPEDGPALRFAGEPDRMRFVADLPHYLGQGGPHLHDFRIEPDPEGEGNGAVRVLLDLRMVLGGEALEDLDGRPPELLVEGLGSASFRYRGIADDGSAGPWQERWERTELMPLMVELRIEDADGRPWPPVRVLLPQSAIAPTAGGTW